MRPKKVITRRQLERLETIRARLNRIAQQIEGAGRPWCDSTAFVLWQARQPLDRFLSVRGGPRP